MKLASHRIAVGRWLCRNIATREQTSPRTKLILGLLIFVLSFCVKSLQAVDLEPLMHTAEQPGVVMSRDFDARAKSIMAGQGILFPDNHDPSDTALLSHAPAYSILLSTIYSVKGRSYFTVQLVQNVINSLSPILLFLIAGGLLGWRVGIVSGLLAAVSHHLAYYSNLILCDSLGALPVLVGVYLLSKAYLRKDASLWIYAAAGAAFGLAAWVRPNPMLMAMFFGLAMLAIAKGRRRKTLLYAVVLTSVSFLTIVPITLRNYVVYRAFIPIQVGVGLNFWEGLGDASRGRFGAVTDDEVILDEVSRFNDPRYGESWASPDGIIRDRDRMRRSLEVISANPVWYIRSIFGRMGEMLKDSAHAPLVFRSSDTKLKEAIDAARAEKTTKRSAPNPLDEDIDAIDHSSLSIGKRLAWLRPPARALQRATKETGFSFLMAGVLILLIASARRTLFILTVPLYYLLVQSVMHTEFRYTLPMRYFLFVPIAILWTLLISGAMAVVRRMTGRGPATADG